MNVLVDSSAWVEYLRATDSAQHRRVRELIASEQDATTDPVMLEVLAGAAGRAQTFQLSRLLNRSRYVPQSPREDVLNAADVYQRCRAAGESVRSVNDCLIAAVAIRAGIPVLHRDRDFEVMARHTDLQVAS